MWGATATEDGQTGKSLEFQSAHPYVGCDDDTSIKKSDPLIFQSAHPYVGCDIQLISLTKDL